MLLNKYYAICVGVPSGCPDVLTLVAEDESKIREIPFYLMKLALIGIVKAH